VSIITVSNATALKSALTSAHSGDVIQLAAGQYDGLSFKNLSFANDVTITSADPSHQAVLTNFTVTNVTGLTISNVEMTAQGAVNAFAFRVSGSKDIHFDHVDVHGSMDGDASNDANGISFLYSSDVSVTNSTFHELGRGLSAGASSYVDVTGNTVREVRSDGFDFAQVDHVTIKGNNLSNFAKASGDHPDAIQFWTSGTTAPSHDIVISGNVISLGDGLGTQGIFLTDQLGTMPYSNVTISDNLIDGTGYNGIRLGHVNGLTLTGNQLTTNPGSNVETWIYVSNSDHVVSTDNSALMISFPGSTNVTQTGDKLVGVNADYGNANLKAWLDAHGMGDLYDSLANHTTNAALPIDSGTSIDNTTPVKTISTVEVTGDVVLTGKANLDATGDDMANTMTGNVGANHLYGMGGDDTLDGGVGGSVDTLEGGAGNDTYILWNNANVIIEKPGEGVDTIVAKGDWVLPDNVENLTINNTVTNAWSGTGNTLDNVLIGNGGGNRLDGKEGNDTIDGGGGADQIIGGAGDDQLTGGVGADIFRFGLGSGHDVITDFGAGTDRDTLEILAYKQAGVTWTVKDVGADTMINFSSGDSITLLGVHANQLTSTSTGWFL
jgi:Ca2+-binding RTX toxin-like protein